MIPLIAAAALLGATGYFMWQRHDRCVDLIEAELRRFHYTGIELSMAWAKIGRNTYTYNVRYTDDRGRRHRNRCKVAVGAGDDVVRWEHALERPSAQRRAVEGATNPGLRISSKAAPNLDTSRAPSLPRRAKP